MISGFPMGRPFGVARALQQHGHLRVPYPLAGSEPQPPLLENDAPLFVDLDRVERDVVREVFENGERPIHDRRIAGRDLQLVHRLVEAGVRVHVRAEPHAERLHEAGDLLLRKMLRAVEGHVLDEMREPALVFVFEHRTCLHHEPKLGARLRQPVLADVVAQAVRKRADGDQRIDRNGLAERRVLKVDGRGRLLGAGKADDRRHCKDRQQQANTGVKRHEVLSLNWGAMTLWRVKRWGLPPGATWLTRWRVRAAQTGELRASWGGEIGAASWKQTGYTALDITLRSAITIQRTEPTIGIGSHLTADSERQVVPRRLVGSGEDRVARVRTK